MKHHIIISLFLLFFFNSIYAQTDEKIIVHLKNGEQISYSMDDVDFVELQTVDSNNHETIATIGGTCAEIIDLGLSVLWADHNLGATYPTDAGGYFEWNDENIRLWGEGWRLPTDEEWQELYDRCKWNWTIKDGIGGREIISNNGKSIFIPASGIHIGDNVLVNGCIGIYWTADAYEAEEGNQTVKAVGTYFDSANIYRIDYPTDNKFNIRLVMDKK